jgi:hypothetical protein
MTSRRAERQRRKSRSKNYRGQQTAIADRRARDVSSNAHLRIVEIEDPGEVIGGERIQVDGKISVVRSLRDDPLGHLRDRGRVDDAQLLAGRAYQTLYEIAEISSIKAMDTTKEPVDGGNMVPSPFSDAKLGAVKDLIALDKQLGRIGARLCRDILIERKFLRQIAESFGVPTSERSIGYVGKRFTECLETLAVELGYAQERRKSS